MMQLRCDRCKDSLSIPPNPIEGRGNTSAPIMVIGQDPGHTERDQHSVFVGRCRKVLEELFLPGFGIPLDKVYITNLVKCYGCGKVPSQVVVHTCKMTNLESEIEWISPKIMVLLGNICVRAFLGSHYPSVMESHGRIETVAAGGANRLVVPFYHPGYYLYARNKRWTIEGQVARDGQVISKVVQQFIT